MINKKGATFGKSFVIGIFLLVVFLVFFAGGGISTILDISKFIKSVPAPIWVILGIFVLFALIKKK